MTDQSQSAGQPPQQPEKKTRRLWWKVLVILLLLIIVLIALLPTLASTGPVRRIILSQVNARLPGRLAVDDWSLGWFSGTRANGVKYFGPDGHERAAVGSVSTELTVLDMVRGKWELGQTLVKDVPLDWVVPVGERPAADRVAPAEVKRAAEPGPAKAIAFSGTLRIENLRGKVSFVNPAGESAGLELAPSNVVVVAPSQQPITLDAVLNVVQEGKPAQILAKGSLGGVVPEFRNLLADINLTVDPLELEPFGKIVRVAGVAVDLGGVLGGQLAVVGKTADKLAVRGEFGGQDLRVGGEVLKGDVLRSRSVRLPIQMALVMHEGVQRVKINELKLGIDQGEVSLSADLPRELLTAGGDGYATVTLNLPGTPDLVNSLRNTLALKQGVRLTEGAIDGQFQAQLAASTWRLSGKARMAALAAQRDGERIGPLKPVTADFSARAQSVSDLRAIRDLSLRVNSAFMTLSASGPTLATLRAELDADLAQLKSEWGQVFDLAMIRSGQLRATLDNASTSMERLEPTVSLNVTNLDVDLSAADQQPLRQLQDGQLQAQMALSYAGGLLQTTQPVSVEMSGRLVERKKNAPVRVIVEQSARLTVAGEAHLTEDVRSATVSELKLTVGRDAPLAELSLTQPLVIEDLSSFAQAKWTAQTRLVADVGQWWGTMNAGKKQAYQLDGMLESLQTVAVAGGDLAIELEGAISDLTLRRGAEVIVREPKVTFAGDVQFAAEKRTLTMDQLAIRSEEGLLDLLLKGRVAEVGGENRFEDVTVEWTPDLGRIWSIIHAMLPAEQQARIGELVFAGRRKNVVRVEGSYPMGVPPAGAMQQVRLTGDFGIEKAEWKKYGLTLDGMIPFVVADGRARFVTTGQQGDEPGEPLNCNGGKVLLSGASVNLLGDVPRLDIVPNSEVAEDIQLNRVMVASLGVFANPMFLDPQNATGRVSVTAVRCEGLPLSAEAMYDPADKGFARFAIDVRNLDLASEGANRFYRLLGIAPEEGRTRVVGRIRGGQIEIARGKLKQDVTLDLGDQQIQFDGTMRLADVSYQPLNVGLPAAMVESLLDKLVGIEGTAKYLPQRVTLAFQGPASSLALDRRTLQSLVSDVAKKQVRSGLIESLAGERKEGAEEPKRGADLGGLLEGILGGRSRQPAEDAPATRPTTRP